MVEYFSSAIDKITDYQGQLKDKIENVVNKKIFFERDNYVGVFLLIIFIVQFVTGLALSLYYEPSPEGALPTIKFIMNEVPFGWLIRSIHYWGGQLFIGFMVIQLIWKYVKAKFHSPYRITWISGFIGFGVMWMWHWTGEFITWGQKAFWSVSNLTEELNQLPLLGEYLRLFLRGGETVGSPTLVRFYVFHTIFFLVFFVVLIFVHLYPTIKRRIYSSEKGLKLKVLIYDFVIVAFFTFAVLMALSVFLPREVPAELDLAHPPASTWVPWYIFPFYEVYTLIPVRLWIVPRVAIFALILMVFGAIFIGISFVPKERKEVFKSLYVLGYILLAGYVILAIVWVLT